MLDLGRADAVRQCAERAMGGGVAVAADDGGAGQREALLRADDVHDALAMVEFVVIFDAELSRVLGQRLNLERRLGIVDALAAVGRRHVVIDHGERLLRSMDAAARHAQALERLRARHLVDEMPVDVEKTGAVGLRVYDVIVPNLIIQRFRHWSCPRAWMKKRGSPALHGADVATAGPDAQEGMRRHEKTAGANPADLGR